jgi:hypothetical protein
MNPRKRWLALLEDEPVDRNPRLVLGRGVSKQRVDIWDTSENALIDDVFTKYGLSGFGINPLRGLLSGHSRSGLYPRLMPRPEVGD